MTIPHNITREHVLKALREINEKGVPEGKASRTWFLLYEGKRYPPKYVISLANKYANGYELPSSEFITTEAVSYLRKLGFEVVRRTEEVEEEEEEFFISLERDLENYLASNIEILERGLRLVGRQVEVATGRVDLLAEDSEGNLVVIELKAGEAGDSSLTQLLAYISAIQEKEKGRNVRGILIAHTFPDKVAYAARLIPYVKLKRYRVRFEFEDVKI